VNTQAEVGLVREAWSRTKKFVLPEETVSLKTIFDNVRNYLMCAAVVGALGASAAADWPWTLVAFSIALIAANALQSWFIVEKWTARIGRFQTEVRPRWGKFKRRLMRVVLVVILLPVFTAMFQGFALLVQWALRGGK
jgi:hypothetical protein